MEDLKSMTRYVTWSLHNKVRDNQMPMKLQSPRETFAFWIGRVSGYAELMLSFLKRYKCIMYFDIESLVFKLDKKRSS